MRNVLHNLIVSVLIWQQNKRGKYTFRKWIQLENLKEKVLTAVENRQPDFPEYLFAYISTAVGMKFLWTDTDWIKVVELFYACISKSPVVKLPITSPTGEKHKDDAWNYDGRMWHVYSHILADAYGWTLEYISQLQVDEALAKIQEILTDKQLEHEFFYGLSEVAYVYDKHTKKSNFQPLTRPHWMRPALKPVPRFKIAKNMLPVGVVKMDGVPDEFLPKEITT